MKIPRPSAIKSWSAGNLALVILAGILSVWMLGAIAYGMVSDIAAPAETEAAPRSVPSTSANVRVGSEATGDPAISSFPPVASPAAEAPANLPRFSVKCDDPRGVGRQAQASYSCRVASINGFAETVSVTCANLPKGLGCEPVPNLVTLAPNGTGAFKLVLSNGDVAAGVHSFKVIATLGNLNSSFTFPFDTIAVSPAPGPAPAAPGTVEIGCETGSTRLIPGQTISYKCSYTSELFYGEITTSCVGTPGVACEISPRTVSPRDGQPAEATLTLSVSPNASSAGNNQVIAVYGDSAALSAPAPRPVQKFTVDVPAPDYALSCAGKTTDLNPGSAAALTCQVFSSTGYVGPIFVKAISLDEKGPQVTVTPASVQVGANRAVDAVASFSADLSAEPGIYKYVLGVFTDQQAAFEETSGDTSRQVNLTVTVPSPPSPDPSPTPSQQST